LEDITIVIRAICQDLYENLRYNNSILSNFKSKMYLNKLMNINKKNDYKYAETIRDELGILYKNYIIFCRKQEYENNVKALKEIKSVYMNLCYFIEQRMVNDKVKSAYPEYIYVENYINELSSTYGGQTEKYIKKLAKKNLGAQKAKINKIYKDKSKIIAEKKRMVINLLEEKLNDWNYKYSKIKNVKILYNSEKAEYLFIKKKNNEIIKRKKYKFKETFSDIERLQKEALKKLRQMNFGISIYEELGIEEESLKYLDPFIVTIFIEEGYLDYAKLYIRQLNGESQNKRYKLPFKIVYNIDSNYKNGVLTPIRNEIIAIIAERASLSVAELNRTKKMRNLKIG